MKLPFASDALWFLFPLALVAAILFLIGFKVAFWVTVALFVFVIYFFRDPRRVSPEGEDLLVSPADGKVVRIDTAYESADHENGCVAISIFLSIFNVHIQRVPIGGVVQRRAYNKGKFLAAWDHKAIMDNEQALTVFDTDFGTVSVKQIAGFVARRIVGWLGVGDSVKKNEKLGLIKFGSRVDLIMPPGMEIVCKVGDHVVGGETVMARARMEKE